MGKKSKPAGRAEPSAQMIASIAGVSLPLVYRKLAQGKSAREIIAESVERERQSLADLPVTPVNGHAAGVPSYAESQAVKEYHLAALRGLEVKVKSRELYPLQPLRAICFTGLNHLRIRFTTLPDELAQQFGAEHAAILRTRIQAIFDEAGRVTRRECERYGAPWPEGEAAGP